MRKRSSTRKVRSCLFAHRFQLTIILPAVVRGVVCGSRDMFEDMNRAISARSLRPVVDKVRERARSLGKVSNLSQCAGVLVGRSGSGLPVPQQREALWKGELEPHGDPFFLC